MIETVKTRFGANGNHYRDIFVPLSEFRENNPLIFSSDEEASLLGNLEDLKNKGLDGFAHIVFRKTWTGIGIEQSIPEPIKTHGLYHQYHVMTPADFSDLRSVPPFRKFLRNNPNNVILIDAEGNIDLDNRNKLIKALNNRVGIILGGGPGNPHNKFYNTFLKYFEQAIGLNTPFAGVCMGHELSGVLLGHSGDRSKITAGFYDLGNTMEKPTNLGRVHPLFSRFGEFINIVKVNQLRIELAEPFDHGVVLAKTWNGEPSALSVNFAYAGQAITWQAHPEFSMIGAMGDKLENDKTIEYHAAGETRRFAISNDLSVAYAGLIAYAASDFNNLQDRYGAAPQDLENLSSKTRLSYHLGKDFYGPLLAYMALQRIIQT